MAWSTPEMSPASTPPPGVIDTHAHIYVDRFADDFDAVLARAGAAGVERIVMPATQPSEFERTLRLAEEHPTLHAAIGVHPHHAAEIDNDALNEVERINGEGNTVAVGEIGLDYYYDFAPRERQQEVFRRQLQLARHLDLPAVIHNRESDDDVLRIIEEEQDGTLRFQLHCFGSSMATLQRALELGGTISFTGNVTWLKALPEIVRAVPDDRLMLETDAPYLTPVPHRGRRNEPSYVPLVAERVAALRGQSIDDICRMTSFNARSFFRLPLLLLILLAGAATGRLHAQERPADTSAPAKPTIPYDRTFGIGGHFSSVTFISGSTTIGSGKTGVGLWLSSAPLQSLGVDWLQVDAIYNHSSFEFGDSSYLAVCQIFGECDQPLPRNDHTFLEFSLRFIANPSKPVNFFGSIGITHFHNEFGQDQYIHNKVINGERLLEPNGIENAWGINGSLGLSYSFTLPYFTIVPTAEWTVTAITSERPLSNHKEEFFVSMPRIGLLIYPNFKNLLD